MPSQINFFRCDCKQDISESLFGLVEDIPARVSLNSSEMWDAIVENNDNHILSFTPIDHKFDLRRNGEQAKKIDAMLHILTKIIILVELKAQNDKFAFFTDANKQLKSTIDFIKEYNQNELSAFQLKYAFIANRVRPINHSISVTHTKNFLKLTGFILQVTKDSPNNLININALLDPFSSFEK
ncbi:MAG: hypothetical protein K2Y14_05850 [Burkholderiales bacterium]|nr:hypothetical protein [Burkholderiales bacterium]